MKLFLKNILNDYKDGIINAKLTVICGDYYDINGNKVIDWQKGEVLQVGDIVRVDKDNEGTTAADTKTAHHDILELLAEILGMTVYL